MGKRMGKRQIEVKGESCASVIAVDETLVVKVILHSGLMVYAL